MGSWAALIMPVLFPAFGYSMSPLDLIYLLSLSPLISSNEALISYLAPIPQEIVHDNSSLKCSVRISTSGLLSARWYCLISWSQVPNQLPLNLDTHMDDELRRRIPWSSRLYNGAMATGWECCSLAECLLRFETDDLRRGCHLSTSSS